MKRILVVDGQGGGIGCALIERLKARLPAAWELIAVGTNAAAAAAMRKAGAQEAVSGENAVVYNAPRAQVIAGSVGIIAANAILGELSPAMANAIAGSDAVKVLIPMNRCNLRIAGVTDAPLPEKLDAAVSMILAACGES